MNPFDISESPINNNEAELENAKVAVQPRVL